ncbi:MAG: hypothetical protein U0Q22_13945 [Acidimicrobiales bacterium]
MANRTDRPTQRPAPPPAERPTHPWPQSIALLVGVVVLLVLLSLMSTFR